MCCRDQPNHPGHKLIHTHTSCFLKMIWSKQMNNKFVVDEYILNKMCVCVYTSTLMTALQGKSQKGFLVDITINLIMELLGVLLGLLLHHHHHHHHLWSQLRALKSPAPTPPSIAGAHTQNEPELMCQPGERSLQMPPVCVSSPPKWCRGRPLSGPAPPPSDLAARLPLKSAVFVTCCVTTATMNKHVC